MEFIIIGIAAAFNFIVIKFKLENRRYIDAIFDGLVLFLLSYIFAGTYAGMVVATIGSAIVSLYLYKWPPKFLEGFNND